MRTEALVKSLEVNAVDDATLIGLLILALNARNVSIQTHGSGHATRTKLVQSITEGGRLSHDVERLRVVARQTLANVLSCSLGHGDSGLPARIAGDAIGADAHLGNMATEEFLSCLSKTAIERVGSSLNVLPRQRVKDTRAAVIAEAAGSTYIHPAALFALSQAEIAHHSEAPRDYSWAYRETDDASDETTEEADGASGAENDSLEPEPDDDLDNLNSDENAHLDDEDPPIVQERARAPAPPSGGGRVAGQFIPIVRNAGAATRRPRSHTTDTGGASWPDLTTNPVAPALTPRTNFAGSTSSSNANAPPAAAIPATAIRNDGARRPGAGTCTRRHTHRAS